MCTTSKGSLARLAWLAGTKKILVHLIAMKTKPLILFGLATVAAFATTASAQNASSSGTPSPKRNQNPANVHISPKPTAIPSRSSTKNVVSRKKHEDKHVSYAEAFRRYRHGRHDRVWWKQHHVIIVLVAGGYYYWDSGYGVRHGGMILATKVTTTMDQSTPTVTCCPTKLLLMCSMP